MNSLRSLILFGFKGCGKSYYGRLLADELYLSFFDTDQMIEGLYERESFQKLSCRQIALKDGIENFRSLERRAISLLSKNKQAVISVGGGSILDPHNCKNLEELGALIYLQTSQKTLKSRVLSKGIPAYLDPHDPEGSFDRMYQFRKPIYEKIDAICIHTDEKEELEILRTLKGIFYGK